MTNLFDLNEPIGLWELPISPSAYRAACFRALADTKTLVLLDTNVLSLAFRLHQEAREGLFKLLRIPLASKRLIVPGWVANEYVHNAFKATKNGHGFREADLERLRTSLPATKQLSAILHQVASDRDMERIAKRLKVAPADASRALNEHVEKLAHALADAGGDLAIDAVHKELLTELRYAFVSNDLGEVARALCEQAAYRRSSRIPPGLTDAAKAVATDGEEAAGNADGDLAVWLEILQLSEKRTSGKNKATDFPVVDSVLFITQEKKEDFLYRPRRRLADEVKKQPLEDNPDIRLIDPRLVAEFEFRVGHRRVAFVNLESIAAGALAEITEREFQDSVGMFVAAIRKQKRAADTRIADASGTYTEPAEEQTVAAAIEEATPLPGVMEPVPTSIDDAIGSESEPAPEEVGELDELPVTAAVLIDIGRLASIPELGKWAQVVASLISENRRAEEMAIGRLQLVGASDSADVAFSLGRAVFFSMQRDTPKAGGLFARGVRNRTWQRSIGGQAFIAGGLFEAFFESSGRLRQTVLREGLPFMLDLVAQDDLKLARAFIHAQLVPFTQQFFWIPGNDQLDLQVTITYEPENDSISVRSVTANYPGKAEIPLLSPKQNDLQSSYLGNSVNFATLRAALSRLTLLSDEHIVIRLDGPSLGNYALSLPADRFINTELITVPLETG